MPPDNLWLIDIKGQSNGAGAGPLPPGGVVLPTVHADRLWLYTNGGQWHPAFDPMVSISAAYGGLQYAVLNPTNIGAGFGLAFAQKLADLTANVNIGCINNAVGGTSMVQNAPSVSTATLYGAGRARTNAAKAHGRVKLMIYVGGEEEARSSAAASGLVANFTAIVNQYRNDHGRDVIVIFAQLGTNPNDVSYPNWDDAKAAQATISIPGVYMIPTGDLAKQVDGVHYTNASYHILGERAAIEYRRRLTTLPAEAF